jgi:5-methylcytosine-specific restriction endonuclease McrA
VNYKAYLHTQAWRNLSTAVKERDRYRCRLCGSRDELEVHHKTYARIGHESLDDLVTLCHRCHTIVTVAGKIGKLLGWKR